MSKQNSNKDWNHGGEKNKMYENLSPVSTPQSISTGTEKIKEISEIKFEILNQLYNDGKKSKSISSIANKVEKDRKTVRYHLESLKKLGFVEYTGTDYRPGIWKVSIDGERFILRGGDNLVVYERTRGETSPQWLHPRTHNISIKVEVKDRPKSNAWLEDWNSNPKMRNNIFYTNRFGDIGMTYTGRSIIFRLPPLEFKDSDIALSEAFRFGNAMVLKLEEEIEGLKLSTIYKKNIKIQLSSQHHAIVNEPFAKWMHSQGLTYRDESIDIDASTGTPELEFTDSQGSHEHVSNYIDFVKDFATNKVPKTSDIAKIIYENNLQIKNLEEQVRHTQNQLGNLTRLTTLITENTLSNIENKNKGGWEKWQ